MKRAFNLTQMDIERAIKDFVKKHANMGPEIQLSVSLHVDHHDRDQSVKIYSAKVIEK